MRTKEPFGQKLALATLLVFVLPLFLPLGLILLLVFVISRACVYALVWCVWLPKGENALIVYSESPIWRDYMLDEIVPMFGDRAVVLNWSERKTWRRWSIATLVFRSFAGVREFNPIVIVFPRWQRARVFRFWSAFKEFKHGAPAAVHAMRRELQLYV